MGVSILLGFELKVIMLLLVQLALVSTPIAVISSPIASIIKLWTCLTATVAIQDSCAHVFIEPLIFSV